MTGQTTLEQVIDETQRENEKVPMNLPNFGTERYDRNAFLQEYDAWEDLLEGRYAHALNENINDYGAKEDLFGALFGDPNFHITTKLTNDQILRTANDSHTAGIESLARYAQVNKGTFLDKLTTKNLVDLTQQLALYKSGDEEHDGLVTLYNEVKGMGDVLGEKDEEKKIETMRRIVIGSLKTRKGLTKKGQSLFAYLAQSDGVAEDLFKKMAGGKASELNARLGRIENGELAPDGAKYLTLIETSLVAAEDALTRKIKDKDKTKIWEKAIMPYYARIAQKVFNNEKGIYESETKTQEQKDMDAEKKVVKTAGIPM